MTGLAEGDSAQSFVRAARRSIGRVALLLGSAHEDTVAGLKLPNPLTCALDRRGGWRRSKAYRKADFKDGKERIEFLFEQYQKLISPFILKTAGTGPLARSCFESLSTNGVSKWPPVG
jgi:hypothetical protein